MVDWTDEAIAAFWRAMPTTGGPLKRKETEEALNAAVAVQGLVQKLPRPDPLLPDYDLCSRYLGAIGIDEIKREPHFVKLVDLTDLDESDA